MNSKNIVSLADPVNAQDAATKNYVDLAVQGLHVHDSCYVGTTGTLATASGGTVSYNNGSSGVGATLTTTGTYLLIDGGNVQTAGTRILVKNEANAAWNGIYTYTNTTTLTRATDFDTTAEAAGGDFVFITSGSTQADTGWVQTTDNPVIGTSNIVWTQFSGAGTYTAGTGLTLTGTQFSITNTAVTSGSYGNGDRVASFTVNAQGQLTAASNVVIAANAANLTGTTLNSSIVTSSLTSVGTLGSLAVTGNVTAGNANVTGQLISTVATSTAPLVVSSSTLVPNLYVARANVADLSTISTVSTGNYYVSFVSGLTGNLAEGANSVYIANIANGSLAATTFVGALSGAATTAGTVTTAAQPNITSVGSLSSLTVTGNGTFGNINGGNLITANFSSAVLTTAAQPNITSVGTLTGLGVNGTITGVNITANTGVFTGNANGISSVQAANIVGTTLSSTVVTSSLTTVGTLGSLNVSGNITAPNVIANTGYFISSVATGISAAGTAQGNATAITREINVVSTVASGAGVVLPTAVAGMRITIVNTSANALLVYPASGGTINSLALNGSFSEAAGARLDFVATSTTQWYTLNATYA
jgi:hypothetical protein